MHIEKGRRVRLKAKLTVEGGDVLEESVVEYFQGSGKMLPGLEAELEGLGRGDTKQGVIEASRAFGSEEHQPRKSIPRTELPKDAKLEKGMKFQAKSEEGQDVILEVLDFDDEAVQVRLVHPLADKNIAYEVEVLSVTDPTPPPLPSDALGDEDAD